MWCIETCQCECRPEDVPKYCGPLKKWNNETCTCECETTVDDCGSSLYEFKYDSCQCECVDPNPGDCAVKNPAFSWDETLCRCDCADDSMKKTCPASNATAVKSWNSTACECQCKKANIKVCDSTLFYPYNYDTCTCDCINDPPEGGCPKGKSWSRNICDCETCTHCINPNQV